jgi:hypothetical protein
MRAWARQRLFDDQSEQFSDPRIDSALNVGAQQVQRAVQLVDPDAFSRLYTRNLLTDTYRYQVPRGFLRHKNLILNGVPAVAIPEQWITLQDVDQRVGFYLQGVDSGFAISGGEYRIYPTPTADLEDGFKLWYVPTLAMNEDSDDLGDYGLVEPLHMAVVLWAVKLLMPESGEKAGDLDGEIRLLMSDIGTYYPASPASVGPGHQIEVEGLGKEYN